MRKPVLVFCAAFLLGSAMTGLALASDPRLDDALANLIKAEALLKASDVPPRARDDVRKAVENVRDAMRHVERAKQQSD